MSQRAHLRAPLRRKILIEHKNRALLAHGYNISEGGALIFCEKSFEIGEKLKLLLDIPSFPHLPRVLGKEIRDYRFNFEARVILNQEVQVVRTVEDGSVGVSFLNLSGRKSREIRDYVARSAINTIYLLSQLQKIKSKDHANFIFRIANFMGYQNYRSLDELHSEVLHDYQSLVNY